MDWDAAERDARESVAQMPPAMRCAAARSGTAGSLNVAAMVAHDEGTCPCGSPSALEEHTRAALRADLEGRLAAGVDLDDAVDDLMDLARAEGQRIRALSQREREHPIPLVDLPPEDWT